MVISSLIAGLWSLLLLYLSELLTPYSPSQSWCNLILMLLIWLTVCMYSFMCHALSLDPNEEMAFAHSIINIIMSSTRDCFSIVPLLEAESYFVLNCKFRNFPLCYLFEWFFFCHSSNSKMSSLGVKAETVTATLIPCTVMSMAFFDKLYERDQIVRQSGHIKKCLDEFFGDFVASDELRQVISSCT